MKQSDPQFKMRLLPDLKQRLEGAAKANNRTLGAEINARLEASFHPVDEMGEVTSSPEHLTLRLGAFLAYFTDAMALARKPDGTKSRGFQEAWEVAKTIRTPGSPKLEEILKAKFHIADRYAERFANTLRETMQALDLSNSMARSMDRKQARAAADEEVAEAGIEAFSESMPSKPNKVILVGNVGRYASPEDDPNYRRMLGLDVVKKPPNPTPRGPAPRKLKP